MKISTIEYIKFDFYMKINFDVIQHWKNINMSFFDTETIFERRIIKICINPYEIQSKQDWIYFAKIK